MVTVGSQTIGDKVYGRDGNSHEREARFLRGAQVHIR